MGLREVIYTELYPRFKLSLLLQQYYFPVSAFSCPKDSGSAPVACAHLGEGAIHHRQETCCTQQVSSHLLLLLQWGLQILKRCITCTLQTAIHHHRAVPQTPRHTPASCSVCTKETHLLPLPTTLQRETKHRKLGRWLQMVVSAAKMMSSLSPPEWPSAAKVPHNH